MNRCMAGNVSNNEVTRDVVTHVNGRIGTSINETE